jgi:hypothetical protein
VCHKKNENVTHFFEKCTHTATQKKETGICFEIDEKELYVAAAAMLLLLLCVKMMLPYDIPMAGCQLIYNYVISNIMFDDYRSEVVLICF